jgi:ComF family protein
MAIPHFPLQTWTQKALDILLPVRCFGCGEIIGNNHSLCSRCWKSCSFLSPPWCSLCGWPFPYETPGQTVCIQCYRFPPLFIQGRSVLAYQEFSRTILLKFKHGDATHLAPGLARLMLRVGKDILSSTDLLVPVPLHWKRLFWRQYNQAALLSHQLSHLTGVPTSTGLIKRQRSTQKQGQKSRKERYFNVKGAFVIPPNHRSALEGKSVTLIDDVFTTGATLNECTSVLLQMGVKDVRILTIARVITSM